MHFDWSDFLVLLYFCYNACISLRRCLIPTSAVVLCSPCMHFMTGEVFTQGCCSYIFVCQTLRSVRLSVTALSVGEMKAHSGGGGHCGRVWRESASLRQTDKRTLKRASSGGLLRSEPYWGATVTQTDRWPGGQACLLCPTRRCQPGARGHGKSQTSNPATQQSKA